MERVSGAEEQMKPHIVIPRPEIIAGGKNDHDYQRVKRHEVRRESDKEVGLADDDVPAIRGHFKTPHAAAAQPGGKRMSEFMSENVNPHGLGQHQIDHPPARSTTR